ncbi:hypothetical protein L798_11959 [Zootermopsis nevadensis]|uniref:Uncharacterized protein n=1 Tax=Zootermopsis nevadensis TaxID=136037 RepID=A0A067QXD1_ZOONE|nr:hypothetical protein L798_11959 [Zootermopsis nevadensis]
MEVIKEEPNSDEEIHPISSQNEHCLVYTKDNHSVHATFFVVGTETENAIQMAVMCSMRCE